MPFIEALSAIAPIAQNIVAWGIGANIERTKKRQDIAKAFHSYQTELKENWAILAQINLDKIDTKDIKEKSLFIKQHL